MGGQTVWVGYSLTARALAAPSNKEEPLKRTESALEGHLFSFSLFAVRDWFLETTRQERQITITCMTGTSCPQPTGRSCAWEFMKFANATRTLYLWTGGDLVSLRFCRFEFKLKLQRIRFSLLESHTLSSPAFCVRSIGTKVGICPRIKESVLQRPLSLFWFSLSKPNYRGTCSQSTTRVHLAPVSIWVTAASPSAVIWRNCRTPSYPVAVADCVIKNVVVDSGGVGAVVRSLPPNLKVPGLIPGLICSDWPGLPI